MNNENFEDDNYILYLIKNTKYNYTYVGITNNPERRIRQHNNEIKGGAKYTHNKKLDGCWEYYGFILGLNKKLSLSIEKKIHIYSKKYKGSTSLEKRLNCIKDILKNYNNLKFIII